MTENAKAQADNKMNKTDVAVEATLAESHDELHDELQSFGRAKLARLKYSEEQYKKWKLLRDGVYLSIPQESPFRSKSKPYSLRMKPQSDPSKHTSTSDCITYLRSLVCVMITRHNHRGYRSSP
jgi:hypothetical protein